MSHVGRTLLEYVSADPGAPITVDRIRQGIAGDVLARAERFLGGDVATEYYVNDLSGAPLVRETHAPWTSLGPIGVEFDHVVKESDLVGSGAVGRVVADLLGRQCAEVRDGAVWLLSARLGDTQDRVLQRADGSPTYLAVDLAYHREKFKRGFDRAVDLWDTQHEPYVARTWAGLGAMGFEPDRLRIVIVHPVRVLEAGMERRTGPGESPWTMETLMPRITPAALRLRLCLFPLGETAWIDLDLGKADPLMHRIDRAVALPVSPNDSDPALVLVRAQAKRFVDSLQQAVEHCAPNRIAECAIDIASAMVSAGRATPAARKALLDAMSVLGLEVANDA